jgi:hypothetical protein
VIGYIISPVLLSLNVPDFAIFSLSYPILSYIATTWYGGILLCDVPPPVAFVVNECLCVPLLLDVTFEKDELFTGHQPLPSSTVYLLLEPKEGFEAVV